MRTSQTPKASFQRTSTSPTLYSLGKPALKDCGGSKRTFGNMKRAVATRLLATAAAKAVQATGSDQRNSRRESPEGSLATGAAGGAAGAGFAGGGAATPVGASVTGPSVMGSPRRKLLISQRLQGSGILRGRSPKSSDGLFNAEGAEK